VPGSEIEQRLARLESFRDIANLQGRYNHYLQTGQIGEKLSELFALENPGVRAEMGDSGLWEGGAGVVALFQHMGRKYSMPGALMVHMLLTPVLEVGADNLSARGMWNSLGTNTCKGPDGRLEAMWQAGKYDIRFCRESGVWKYLDFRWYVIFRTPYSKGWVNQPIIDGLHEPGLPPIGDFYRPYDPASQENVFMPRPPEPAGRD